MKQLEAYKQGTLKTHYKVARVVDGDGLIAYNIFDKKEIEIRLLGIDAPEIKKCKKLLQDELETHVPGQLLIKLGQASFKYLSSLIPKETSINIYTEASNTIDVYGRTLAYVFLPDGSCINETLVREGYAKPYNRFFCSQLSNYQVLGFEAKTKRKGNFQLVSSF